MSPDALPWTRDLPTIRGWYWFLADGDDAYELIYVAPHGPVAKALNVDRMILEIEPHRGYVNEWLGQWSGPLYPDDDILGVREVMTQRVRDGDPGAVYRRH